LDLGSEIYEAAVHDHFEKLV
jgi:hypothetical protein